jgi:hypothetical protein
MNEEYAQMAASSISHAAAMVQHSIQNVVSDYGEPSAIYRPKVFPDGDRWCALYGDNIQDGVCGFGKNPADAMRNFNSVWYGRETA